MNRSRSSDYSQVIFIVFWMMIIIIAGNHDTNPKHSDYEYTYKEEVITSGDRLWNIAEREIENNSYYEGEDPRQVIYEIKKDNDLSSEDSIFPGQVIKIRIKKDELNSTGKSLANSSFNN